MFSKIFKLILKYKFIAGIGLILIIIGSYFGYQGLVKDKNAAQYATAAVEKGTLIVSLSGGGQVSTEDQIDIKPKVSGDVVYVGVQNGQEVKAGALLVQIDSRNAQKAVQDAETSLETTKLELEELLQPADAYSLMQAENALIQAEDNLTKLEFTQESKYQDALDAIEKAEDNLEKAYEDAFNTVADAFLDLPTLITSLKNILHSDEIAEDYWSGVGPYQSNQYIYVNAFSDKYRDKMYSFLDSAEDSYKTAREDYDQNFENYRDASRYSDKETIEALLNQTIETTKAITEAVRRETNMLDYWVDSQSQYDRQIYAKVIEYQSDLRSYTSKTNSHLSGLLSAQRTIEDNEESKLNAERNLIEMGQNNPLDLAAAERSIKEKEESLVRVTSGSDEIDVRAREIAVEQKEDALLDARQNLADHYIYALFDGVVTDINIKRGESISSNTALATLITKQKIAEITVNEIDIVKVKNGQKTNITFDAVEDLNITGEVVEIDTLGAVTQGVVTYGIKIAFDTSDERIRPGMSLSASVITDVRQNVLLVPNSVVKQQGNTTYVETASETITQSKRATDNISGVVPISALDIKMQSIQVGLSNDTMTEILDGLKEGDIVVTQTTILSSTKNESQQNMGSNGQMPGGMIRMMR